MAQWEEKLNTILSDPAAMGQIMSIARSLTGEEAQAEPDPPPAEEEAQVQRSEPEEDPFSSALAGLDPHLLEVGMRLLGEYTAQDNEKAALLAALKPFVRKERWAKMDQAIRIARLSRVARSALKLFREGGEEDEHV